MDGIKIDKNQDQTSGDNPKTIDEYISLQPEEVQSLLIQVRDAIRAVLPDAEERISWRMPTFRKKYNVIHFAAFRNHLGIYPGDKAIEYFGGRLAAYKHSKGAVQFQYVEPIPYDLIADIAKWCYETGNHH